MLTYSIESNIITVEQIFKKAGDYMLYFAYGSNLDINRIISRCPSSRVVGEAILPNYRLVFQENNSGRVVANIAGAKGKTVTGVLYEISSEDRIYLDRCEGHPFVYLRTPVRVEIAGIELTVETYIMGKVNYEVRPYGEPATEYLGYIITGYKQHGLSMRKLTSAVSASRKAKEKQLCQIR